MPVLPIIDLLILLGWTALMAGGVLKAIYITTAYRPAIFGLAPTDFLIIAGVFLALALTLAARSWVKFQEGQLGLAARHGAPRPDVYGGGAAPQPPGSPPEAEASDNEHPDQVYGR